MKKRTILKHSKKLKNDRFVSERTNFPKDFLKQIYRIFSERSIFETTLKKR